LARDAAEPEKLARFQHLLLNRSGRRLADEVEMAKTALTEAPETRLTFDEPGLSPSLSVRRAGLTEAGIDTVILTGGGAQVPVFRRAAADRFKTARVVQSDQFGSVGLGLAPDAARRFA